MKIALYNNKRGIIYGNDAKRISCDVAGVLQIGDTSVWLSPGGDEIMPLLFHGATGTHSATFTTSEGEVYKLESIMAKAGRITAPSEVEAKIMELHCALDIANDMIADLQNRCRVLEGIFDTNALNFLIK